jgi:hypothetical protein
VNIPAVQSRGGSTNRKPKADADYVAFGTTPLEFLEQARRVARRKTRSVICNDQ